MADESVKAARYERLYPETGIPSAQKEERMERLDFKHEVETLRRTGRNRGIVVPALPLDQNGRLRP
jgi:hypothetical protein